MTRRTLLAGLAAAPRRPIGIGFTLYAMKSLGVVEALGACAEIGYDGVELCLLDGYPRVEPREVKAALKQHRLGVAGMMDLFSLLASDEAQRVQLERIRRAAELARQLGVNPVLETVLGGRPAEWEAVRGKMAERLREWARVAEAARITIAIKAHVGGAVHLPEHVLWLLEQAPSPRIRAAYDYSHFQLAGLGLGESLEALIRQTAFIHVKDGRGVPAKFEFLLPGEGTIDYVDYFRRLRALRYRGMVVVEVSAQIHRRPEYDPVAAARQSYRVLATAMEKAA
ncbi:MAG: sugar phosphate isomerase/epimerase [Bryobacteraceae bacterium]|nr:sugar phosphate isomerase/epimerase [Bryobacteraceae bacterium]